MGSLELMQGLTGAADQGLAASLAELPVALKLFGELVQPLLLMRRQRMRHLAQGAAQKGLKGFTPALQIAETVIGFQL
jgi:hypothetical protein